MGWQVAENAERVRIAVVGCGLIGRRHATAIGAAGRAELACIVDPSDAAGAVAAGARVPHFRDLEAALAAGGLDGVVLATPNQLHREGALACIAAGLPVLVEKPLAGDAADGRAIVEAAERAGVPVLTGHHRRYNPIIARARSLIEEGALGSLVALHATTWFLKPDDYFDTEWRRRPGGGPIFINLIHEIDLLMHLAGPVAEISAMRSAATRGFEVEDTAVVMLRFESGALGTMTLSDTIAAPWSWEMTAGENPAYPATGESAYWIGGTKGALALPNLALWSHPGVQSWWAPISATAMPLDRADPLVRQIDHFAEVIADGVPPIVSGRDGLAALEAVEAIDRAARGR